MKVVHFGAGNIGRGFVGLLLHQAGASLVFADVAEALINDLQAADSYTVHAVGSGSFTATVDNFEAVNSAAQPEELTRHLATADMVTTAVGPHILKFVAPAIAAGIHAREKGAPKVAVLACENAVNATDTLAAEIRKHYDGDDLDARALFANTAVDRIVPNQDPGSGLDVTVEVFHEWAVERGPFEGHEPDIPGITWVDNLSPYIERKLFTLNTGHAALAWYGFSKGYSEIPEAIADPDVLNFVRAVLAETSALLVAKHGFSIETQEKYQAKILSRFTNPYLSDTVERVGRGPIRKLSRDDRIIGPAAQLAERGLDTGSLVSAFEAALSFTPQGDPEVDQLQQILAGDDPAQIATDITGVGPDHPLHPALTGAVQRHLAA